ncbi:MAG: VOC family protein [Paracoccaceae bacterium]
MPAQLEHVNYTVKDAKKTAAWLCDLFGWHVRWEGGAMNGQGYTMHVGTDDQYVAIYQPSEIAENPTSNYVTAGGLNHIAVVVDDIDGMEQKILAAGFKTGNHGDYEPGRRFYFHDDDNIEYEVVQYA